MPITASCPRCDRAYKVADTLAGRRVACKSCGQEFAFPQRSASPAEPPQAAPAPRPARAARPAPALPPRASGRAPFGDEDAPPPPGRLDPARAYQSKKKRKKSGLDGLSTLYFFLGSLGAVAVAGAVSAIVHGAQLFGLTIGIVGALWFLWGWGKTLTGYTNDRDYSLTGAVALRLVPGPLRLAFLIFRLAPAWAAQPLALAGIVFGGAAAVSGFAILMEAARPGAPRDGGNDGLHRQETVANAGGGPVPMPVPGREGKPPEEDAPSNLPAADPGAAYSVAEVETVLGPGSDLRPEGQFRDVAPGGLRLVGLRVSYIAAFGNNIGSVQPIFGDDAPRQAGARHGEPSNPAVEALARPGYAVGGVRTRTGLLVDGFCIVYMKVRDGSLDPADTYLSPWYGSATGGSEGEAVSDGRLVVGITGTTNDREIQRLGVVVLK